MSKFSYAEVIEVCNRCSDVQIKTAALQGTRSADTVHVVDFEAGKIKSFDVEHETEPGNSYHWATPVTTPQDLVEGTAYIKSVFDASKARGGVFDPLTNELREKVDIPKHIALSANDVLLDTATYSQTSNYLLIHFYADFYSQFKASWAKLVEKLILKVEAKFSDGTSLIFWLDYPLDSYLPFKLDDAEYNKGKTFTGRESISMGKTYEAGQNNPLVRKCANYVIRSGNVTWTGTVCWHTY
ncbi:hypothetical protein [Rheinheimera sp.]|uniref:hypothetical protein n=1 Tax=Rheinheimera sp. TaxID=1869214 RepID=UPI002FDC8779